MNRIEQLVTEWMEEYTRDKDLDLVEVNYRKEQSNWFLRVYLDKDEEAGGITLEECEQASRWLGQRLDEEDPIPGKYYLEVGSAGLDRPLTKEADYDRFAGRLVEVRTYAPVDGKKRFVGKLLGLNDAAVALVDHDGAEHLVPLDMVARARLHVEF